MLPGSDDGNIWYCLRSVNVVTAISQLLQGLVAKTWD